MQALQLSTANIQFWEESGSCNLNFWGDSGVFIFSMLRKSVISLGCLSKQSTEQSGVWNYLPCVLERS